MHRRPYKVSPALPDNLTPLQEVPLQVLQERHVLRGNTLTHEPLILWSHLPRELDTWEDVVVYAKIFPQLRHGDTSVLKEEGVSQALLLT